MNLSDPYIIQLEKTLAQLKRHQKNLLKKHETGLTPDQWTLIKYINKKEQISQKELAARTGKDPSSIKRILDILEKEGFVKRIKSEDDQRKHFLELTEKGNGIVHKLFPVMIDFEAGGVHGISAEELEIFQKVLVRFNLNYEQ